MRELYGVVKIPYTPVPLQQSFTAEPDAFSEGEFRRPTADGQSHITELSFQKPSARLAHTDSAATTRPARIDSATTTHYDQKLDDVMTADGKKSQMEKSRSELSVMSDNQESRTPEVSDTNNKESKSNGSGSAAGLPRQAFEGVFLTETKDNSEDRQSAKNSHSIGKTSGAQTPDSEQNDKTSRSQSPNNKPENGEQEQPATLDW